MASTLVLLVALCWMAVTRWGQRVGERPTAHKLQAGIQPDTLQGTESGIRKLDANFTHGAKTRASPTEHPLWVSETVWEDGNHKNMRCQG